MEITGRKYAALFADFMAWLAEQSGHDYDDMYTISASNRDITLHMNNGFVTFDNTQAITIFRSDSGSSIFIFLPNYETIDDAYKFIYNNIQL